MRRDIIDELAKQNASPQAKALVSNLFLAKITSAQTYFSTIRDCDDALADKLLKACDLLNDNWDQWHVDPERRTTIFQDDSAVADFNSILADVHAIEKRQIEAQKHYLKIMQ